MSVAILLLMIILLFLGMPVGFALGMAGVVGLYLLGGWVNVEGILMTAPQKTVASYALTAVPMFILMAEFISRSKIIADVFSAAHKWLERVPGGLAIATIIASAGMGAMCGSSTASAATMAKVSVPEMIKYGYRKDISAGIVTVSGTLALMIPPSLTFIYYGMITETSIGKMLIAGIFPGILTAIMYIIGILVWNKAIPGIMPPPTRMFTMKDRFDSLKPLWAFLILIVVVIGSIYSGLATATEAAAFGAFAALIITVLMKRLSTFEFNESVKSTVRTCAMVFTIIVGAMIFGYFLTLTQTTQHLLEWIAMLNVPRWVIMWAVIILYLFLGCIMETTAIQFITLPLTFPLMMSLGYDPIWYGVIITKVIEIGCVTPPVGMNSYIVSGSTGVPLEDVFRGTGMMLAVDVVSLLVLIAFPVISTYLPSLMAF